MSALYPTIQDRLQTYLPPNKPTGELALVFLKFAVFLVIARLVIIAIYNLYFHPLSKYPGPKLAAISGLPYWYVTYRGDIIWWLVENHEKYGEIVRLGPDRLSYTKPEAWKDIYGHRTGGRLENPKDKRFFSGEANGADGLITIPDAQEHARARKIFSNAFSDRALKLQEPLIQKYTDQLIGNISRAVQENPDVEMDFVKHYNCTTFDIMAELSFGEPLGLLENSELSPWVKAVFGNMKMLDKIRVGFEYPAIGAFLAWLTPKHLWEQHVLHFAQSCRRVDNRLERGVDTGKPDIWSLVLDKGQHLTKDQMYANASIFMIAGTETTATVLCGLTYYFLRNRDKMCKAAEEVRTLSKDQLTLERLSALPYLNACFEEAMRVYPATPLGSPREIAKGGNMICGEWLPERTRVNAPQFPMNRNPNNFQNPNSFEPERWLPDSGYDNDRKDALNPFAHGPRNCIGKNLAYHEMRVIMSNILWHFDLELCPQSATWGERQSLHAFWQKPDLWCKARPVRR